MTGDDLHPHWRERLRALREYDRALAPPFEQVVARRPDAARRRHSLRPAWLAVIAVVVLTWLAMFRPSAPVPVQISWAGWQSPTAVLLRDGIGAATPASWRSPTAALARFDSSHPEAPP